MTPTNDPLWDRWPEVDHLLEAALDRAAEDRDAFLADACGADHELLGMLRSLLAHDASPARSLSSSRESLLREILDERGGDEGRDSPPADAFEGLRLGPFELEHVVGRGGLGVVYRAKRVAGGFDQRVAIKLLVGSEGASVLRRFERERAILASLDHPFIATLLDGGIAPDGRPYLVMEYVDGRAITRYCEEESLSIRARLRLFLRVCDAVAAAHARLVVHRDLKPSNILVTGDGSPKLLDFGIARILEAGGSDAPLQHTLTGALSPPYASPEQIRGDPVTTASDVFQLGTLLYLLLAGRRPHDEAETSPLTLIPSILEKDPPLPSEAVASAGVGGIARPRVRSALRGDLDTVIMKALRKEPDRRYGSVAELAEDLRRHLDGMPIRARPDSVGYRLSKFARRNRVAVALGAVAGAALLAGVAELGIHANRLEAERNRAQIESAKAQQVSTFLVQLFESNDPDLTAGETPSAFDLLERGEQRAGALGEQPAVQAEMLDLVARMYTTLGHYDRAEPLFRRALDLRRGLEPPAHADLAITLDQLGDLLQRVGRHEEARPLLFEAAEAARQAGSRGLESDAHTYLGHTLHATGDYTGAEAAYRTALELRLDVFGGRHERTATARHNLALALESQERFAEAETLYVQALAEKRELLDPDHSDIALTLTTLSRLYSTMGDLERSQALLEEALGTYRRRLGPTHVRLGLTLNELGFVAARRGAFEEAEAYFRESLAIHEAALGPAHAEVATGLNNISYVLGAQGRYAEALPIRRRALEIARAALGSEHRNVGFFLHNLADVLDRLGRDAEAEPLYREAIHVLTRTLPPGHAQIARTQARLDSLVVRRSAAPR